jgi:hypothetical protein
MDLARRRKVLRAVHLTSAGAIGFFVYAPGDVTDGTFQILAAVIFFPLLALTGAGMFLLPKLVRRRRSARGQAS